MMSCCVVWVCRKTWGLWSALWRRQRSRLSLCSKDALCWETKWRWRRRKLKRCKTLVYRNKKHAHYKISLSPELFIYSVFCFHWNIPVLLLYLLCFHLHAGNKCFGKIINLSFFLISFLLLVFSTQHIIFEALYTQTYARYVCVYMFWICWRIFHPKAKSVLLHYLHNVAIAKTPCQTLLLSWGFQKFLKFINADKNVSEMLQHEIGHSITVHIRNEVTWKNANISLFDISESPHFLLIQLNSMMKCGCYVGSDIMSVLLGN